MLIDTLADVAGDGEASYTVREGAPRPATGPRVQLEQTPAGPVVDTGAVRVAIPASGDALVEQVEVNGQRVAGRIPLPALVVESTNEREPTPESPRVETDGPVRIELLLRGRWPDGAAYEARLAFFAGQPAVRLRYTLTNMVGSSLPSAVSACRAGRLHERDAGIGRDARRIALLTEAHTVRQMDADAAQLARPPVHARTAGCRALAPPPPCSW